jgi:hypothetical protein
MSETDTPNMNAESGALQPDRLCDNTLVRRFDEISGMLQNISPNFDIVFTRW